MKRISNNPIHNSSGKIGRLILLFFLCLFTLILFTQCSDPIGWVAYGTHIEFTSSPSVEILTGGKFTLSEATAELTISGLALDSDDDILYFMATAGTSPLGTLYVDEDEAVSQWEAAGFTQIDSFTDSTPVDPYNTYGFSKADSPVLDIYAVANTTYTIDGGVEVSPWRVSDVATVDLSPYLSLTINEIPAGTTSLTVTLGGVSTTFSSTVESSGGSQTVQLTGISSQWAETDPSISVTANYSGSPLASLSSTTIDLEMGSNTQDVDLTAETYDILVQFVPDGDFTFDGTETGSYSIPHTATGDDYSVNSSGEFTMSGISVDDMDSTGSLTLTGSDSATYKTTFSVTDLILSYLSSGSSSITLVIMESAVLAYSISDESGELTFTWEAIEGAASYNLYREDSETNIELTDSTSTDLTYTDLTYTDTNITAGTAYTYQLSWTNGNGSEGGFSDSVSITVYSVTYDACGGSGGSNPDIVYCISGESVTPPVQDNIRECCTATGSWSTLASGNGVIYNSDDDFTVTENDTLYAQWKLDDITEVTESDYSNKDGTITFSWDAIDTSCAWYMITMTYTDSSGELNSEPFYTGKNTMAFKIVTAADDYTFRIRWYDDDDSTSGSGNSSEYYVTDSYEFLLE